MEKDQFCHVYYEPVKNKIYFSKWNMGLNPKTLPLATDGKYICPWHFTDSSYRFHYLGEL